MARVHVRRCGGIGTGRRVIGWWLCWRAALPGRGDFYIHTMPGFVFAADQVFQKLTIAAGGARIAREMGSHCSGFVCRVDL